MFLGLAPLSYGKPRVDLLIGNLFAASYESSTKVSVLAFQGIQRFCFFWSLPRLRVSILSTSTTRRATAQLLHRVCCRRLRLILKEGDRDIFILYFLGQGS